MGQVTQTFVICPITEISFDEDLHDFKYDYKNTETTDDGEIIAHQCMNCDYELRDETDETIDNVQEAIDWVRENCKAMVKKYKIVNNLDPNQEQKVEGKTWEKASFDALTVLGWGLVEYEEDY